MTPTRIFRHSWSSAAFQIPLEPYEHSVLPTGGPLTFPGGKNKYRMVSDHCSSCHSRRWRDHRINDFLLVWIVNVNSSSISNVFPPTRKNKKPAAHLRTSTKSLCRTWRRREELPVSNICISYHHEYGSKQKQTDKILINTLWHGTFVWVKMIWEKILSRFSHRSADLEQEARPVWHLTNHAWWIICRRSKVIDILIRPRCSRRTMTHQGPRSNLQTGRRRCSNPIRGRSPRCRTS